MSSKLSVPRTSRGVGWAAVTLAAGLAAWSSSVGSVEAAAAAPAEYVVSTTLDQPDDELGDDICDSDPGPGVRCTLRAAVMQANVTPGADTIRLAARVYRLTVAGAGDDLGQSGDLDVRQGVTIVGLTAGKARSTIDATGLNDRVLDIIANDVSLQNLVITGGSLPISTELGDDAKGGGVHNLGTMTLSDSVVRGNSATSGGGIYNSSGKLTLVRTTVQDNHALGPDTGSFADGGGGILTNASFTMTDSTVEKNTSAYQGGGLTVLPGSFSTAKITRSLIVGNSSQAGGGGIMVEGINDGDLTIDNSTLHGNHDAQVGGGIHAQNLTVPVTLFASTIVANTAPFAGGVRLDMITATNTIFSNNTSSNCVLGFPAEGSYNLSTDNSCFFDDTATNLKDVSARLGPLQFNGGPTRTRALLPDSPAIDAGTFPSLAVLFDQRGGLRIPPGRFPGLGNPHDIGAFEVNALGL